jgi:hypothetical protein
MVDDEPAQHVGARIRDTLHPHPSRVTVTTFDSDRYQSLAHVTAPEGA